MPIQNLDLSNNSFFESLICNDNDALTYINLKNGNNQNITFDGIFASNFENLPNLETICIDDLNNTALIDEITNQVGNPIYFTEDCTLNIEPNIVEETKIFPNPSSSFITIESPLAFQKIMMYDVLGKLVLSQPSKNNICQVDVSNLKTGIYFLRIIGETSFTKRIIKN